MNDFAQSLLLPQGHTGDTAGYGDSNRLLEYFNTFRFSISAITPIWRSYESASPVRLELR